MPTVYLPTIIRRNVDGKSKVDCSGETVAGLLATLAASYPQAGAQLCGDDGRLRPHVNVFVNGDDIRALDGERTELDERDEVQIIMAMAGG